MSYGEPELVPQTPVYIQGRLFNPVACVHGEDYDGDENGNHHCAHDWRCFWGQQNRPVS